jgi:hypothetical protein
MTRHVCLRWRVLRPVQGADRVAYALFASDEVWLPLRDAGMLSDQIVMAVVMYVAVWLPS